LGFDYVGCADRKVDDCSFNIKEINDVKVGFLAYSMVYGILDEEKLLAQIKEVKKQVDLVIVNIHWGVEYEHIARSNQKNLAHKMIDAGADAIIGHHPHVVQNLEIYNNKPIFYSLGNFIFDQYFSNETQEGLAVGLTYESSKMQINLFPFFSEYSKVKLMTDKRKEEFLQWLKDISDVSDDFKKQIENGKINL
jgi:poly-gamma-glutamate synthesis protein (capsule biosynthesis protein)